MSLHFSPPSSVLTSLTLFFFLLGLGLGQEVTRDLIALSLADSEREWGYNQDSSIDWQAVSNVACKCIFFPTSLDFFSRFPGFVFSSVIRLISTPFLFPILPLLFTLTPCPSPRPS